MQLIHGHNGGARVVDRYALGQLQLQRVGWQANFLQNFADQLGQLWLAKLPELITKILQEIGLPPDSLELELTEGVAVDDPRAAILTMDQLHACGVRLAMDDFGTGYSSLSQIKRFPLSKLKIDQSFVRDLGEDANDRAIVSAIIRMAQAMGLHTTAEGVETQEQMDFLQEQGCADVQGYLCGRPMQAEQMQALLARADAATTGITPERRHWQPPLPQPSAPPIFIS